MNRRNFLYSLVAVNGALQLSGWNRCFEFPELLPNTINHVKSGALLNMPSNPKDGDFLHLIVDQESLTRKPTLMGNGNHVLDEKEIVLDQMAILKLVYNKNQANWVTG
jgi:hypothetical protein